MPAVLEFYREQDPRFKAVSDEDLTAFIAETEPSFLKDAEFAASYYKQKPPPSLRPSAIAEAPVEPRALPPLPGDLETPFATDLATESRRLTEQMEGAEGREVRAMSNAEVAKRYFSDILNPAPVPKLTAQDLKDVGIGQVGVGNRRISPEVLAGVERATADLANFFASPLGTATLAIGALPPLAQRVIAGVFAVDMMRTTPEIARQLGDAIGRGDTEAATEFTISGALNTLFAFGTAKHALLGEMTPSKAIGRALMDRLKEPEVQARMEQVAADEALRATLPGVADVRGRPEIPGEPAFRVGDVAPEQPSVAPLTEAAARDVGATVEVKKLPAPEPVVAKSTTTEPVAKPERGLPESATRSDLMADMSQAGRDVWERAKATKDESQTVDATHLTAGDRRNLARLGLSFTEDRAGNILARYPQRLRVEDLRQRVTEGRKEIVEPAVPPVEVRAEVPAETPAQSQRELDRIEDAKHDAVIDRMETLERDPAYIREQKRLAAFEQEITEMEVIAADRNSPDRKTAASRVNELEQEADIIRKNLSRMELETGALETVIPAETPAHATAKAQAEVTDLPADLRAEIERQKTGTGPLSQAERVEMNELEIVLEDRGRLGMLNQARLDHLKARAAEPPAAPETQGAIALPGPGLAPAPANIPSLPPKSQRQIITDLAKGLKLPIRFGRLRTTRFAGYFQRVQNLIGSRKANDIPIVTHEVGHKLDSVFGFASDPALRAELDALGDPAMPGSRSSWTPSKTQKYKLSEGVAEFVRHWLVDPPNAAKLAPNMLRQFEAALNANKDFGDTMRQAQSDIQTWRNAAPQARLRSHISIGENPNKTPYTLDQLTRDVVDDLHFLRLPVEQLGKAGVTLRPSEDPYILARNLRGSYGMADTFIQRGVANFKTKEVTLGNSLEDALKPVAGRIADFRDWIVAKRAQELHAQGRQTGLVDSDVQATVARFDNDAAFNDAFNRIKVWNDSVLQYAQDAGLVTKEGAAAMRQMNQDYVPFHRIFEIGAGEAPAVEGLGTGRGLNVGKPGSLKGLKGSPRDIIDPLETMVRNAYSIITASEKQAINLAVADLSTKPNMGQWVEHIATPKESVKVGLEKIREQLENAGADLTNVPDDLILQFFQNSKFAPFGENIIKVVRDGKPEFYRLKRELFETFHALDLEDSGTLVRMLSQPAQVLRAGVTVAPDFALANALRDAFTAAIVSRHGLLPFEAVFRGMEAMLRNPKLVAEWQAAGGKNAVEASYFDRAKLQQFLAEKITKDLTPAQRAWMVTKSPLQALRWLSSLSEEATRIGEYQKAYTDLRKRGMAEGDARRLAAFESRDRQDFAKGGAKTKIVRRLAAFWNAGLQGNVRLYQAFKEKPLQTTLRGLAFITIPKLIEQSLNWNDEDYWDRPQWQRDLYFMIPAGKGEDNHTRFILIPTPFEAGIIFGTFPGRILQAIREKNPEAAKTFPMTLARQTVPNPTPQWMLTIFEDFMIGKNGWDVYRQRQIVPKSLEQLPPEMQWTEQTSLTARKLGAALGFSPMKIDHIINSTTGGLGRQLTHQVVDRAIAMATGEERTAKGVVPGGRFVSTPAAVSSQAIDDFYTTLDKIKTAAAGQKKGKADPLAAWLPRFSRTERDLAQLRKAMREATAEEDKNVYAEAILRTSRIIMKQFEEAQNAPAR